MNVILRHRDGFAVPFAFRTIGIDRPFGQLADKLIEDFLTRPQHAQDEPRVSTPRVTVQEAEKSYEVEADLPGVSKENIRISVDGSRVTIEAEVKRESEKKEGENVVRAERVVRKFARSFTLASEVDDARAVARLENGVLTLSLPKKEAPQPRQIPIQ